MTEEHIAEIMQGHEDAVGDTVTTTDAAQTLGGVMAQLDLAASKRKSRE